MSGLLLWGAGSFARLALAMSGPDAEHATVYAPASIAPHPALDRCIRDAGTLRHLRNGFSQFIVCIGAEHGFARVMTARTIQRNWPMAPRALLHSRAFVEPSARTGDGLVAFAQATIGMFCDIGNFVIVNTAASIDHECVLGDGVHVMGGAAVAGRVKIGAFATIGTNATVLPDITIGEGAIIGAGSVVTRDVAPWTVVAGVPARYSRDCKARYETSDLVSVFGRAEGISDE